MLINNSDYLIECQEGNRPADPMIKVIISFFLIILNNYLTIVNYILYNIFYLNFLLLFIYRFLLENVQLFGLALIMSKNF